MSFAHPWVLTLLVLPLAALVWGWKRHGHTVVLPADHGAPRPRRFFTFLLRATHSLPAVLLAVVIGLLAGPRQLSEPKAKRVLTNIQFVVDISGSMMSPFGDGDRYAAAMAAISNFIDRRQGDAFGLTAFGDDFLHWVPLTSDPSAMKCASEFLNPRRLPRWFSQGTAIAKALEAAMKVMVQREEGDRLIVLVTDGYSYDLSGGNDEKLAAKLRSNNIVVYCIHVDKTEPPPEVRMIAEGTGGQIFATGDPEGLQAVFQRIDEMQKARVENISAETQDSFAPLAAGALGLLGTMLLASFGIRYVPW